MVPRAHIRAAAHFIAFESAKRVDLASVDSVLIVQPSESENLPSRRSSPVCAVPHSNEGCEETKIRL
jgi:hypothetical protein